MKKIIRLTESNLTRIIKRVINEDMEVSDLERKQLSDKMIKDMIDKYYLSDVVNPTTKVPYKPFNVGGKLDYNKAYREYMEAIDQKLTELGFPNGVNIPENISRQEFDNLKNKWTQASSKLTESDLVNIIKRVISEKGPSGYTQKNYFSGTLTVDCTKKVVVDNTLTTLSPAGNVSLINAFCNQRA